MRRKITILCLLVLILVSVTLINPSKQATATQNSQDTTCNCVQVAFSSPAFTITKHSVKKVVIDSMQWAFPQNASVVFTDHIDTPLPDGVALGGYSIASDGTLTMRFVNPGGTAINVDKITWFSNRMGTGLD